MARGEPEPRFTTPHLPQWIRLVHKMTLERVKKRRTKERGVLLGQKRIFRRWLFVMTLDRRMKLTPEEQADDHYRRKLSGKVVAAWYAILRRRGRIRRIRDKIFDAWKRWAPKKRRLRHVKVKAKHWAKCVMMRHAVDTMKVLCYEVILKRSTALKVMNKNLMDRKVMICLYGLLNMDTHVIMLDCWRKWRMFTRNRANRKASIGRYRYEWYFARNEGNVIIAVQSSWDRFY